MLPGPIATIIRGFCMGAADVVPGVSGGTIALLLGIYERLIDSVRAGSSMLGAIVKLDRDGAITWFKRIEWGFLLPLLAGILIAIASLASVLETLLDDHPVQMSAVFFGLIGGSVIVVWGMLERRDSSTLVIAGAAAAITFIVLGIRDGVTEETVSQAGDPATIAFFGAAMIAICAMILPGVSGSFLLVILGMYSPVIDAVDERELGTIVVFGLGAVLGLALFSQVLHWLLENHRNTVMAVLVGLMAGSTRVLWPWPNGLDSTELGSPDGYVGISIVLAVAAAAIVIVLTRLGGVEKTAAEHHVTHQD